MGGKDPLGRCILEDRGRASKLSLWVQDLKVKASYKVVLILSDSGKHKGVTMGSLHVDTKGKGELKAVFDSTALADGQGLQRLSAVAVLTVGVNELLCPLVGFKDAPVLWKNHFAFLDDNANEETEKTAEPIKDDRKSRPKNSEPQKTAPSDSVKDDARDTKSVDAVSDDQKAKPEDRDDAPVIDQKDSKEEPDIEPVDSEVEPDIEPNDPEPEDSKEVPDIETKDSKENPDVEPKVSKEDSDVEPKYRKDEPDIKSKDSKDDLEIEPKDSKKDPDIELEDTKEDLGIEPKYRKDELEDSKEVPDVEPEDSKEAPDMEPEDSKEAPDMEAEDSKDAPDIEQEDSEDAPDIEPENRKDEPETKYRKDEPDSEPEDIKEEPDIGLEDSVMEPEDSESDPLLDLKDQDIKLIDNETLNTRSVEKKEEESGLEQDIVSEGQETTKQDSPEMSDAAVSQEETPVRLTLSEESTEKFDEPDTDYTFFFFQNDFPARDEESKDTLTKLDEVSGESKDTITKLAEVSEEAEDTLDRLVEENEVAEDTITRLAEENGEAEDTKTELVEETVEVEEIITELIEETVEVEEIITELDEENVDLSESVEGTREMLESVESNTDMTEPEIESDTYKHSDDTPSEEQVQQAHSKKIEIVDRTSEVEMQLEKAEENVVTEHDEINELSEIFKYNIEITPFDTKTEDTQWVRISLREPIFLSIDYRNVVNHPLIVAAYKKYNHLILGRTANDGRTDYILGVPGIFESQYVNIVRQLGFTQFKTVIDSGVLRPGDYGYWLCPMLKHI